MSVKTKYSYTTVTCESCDSINPGPFVSNVDKLACDKCGNVANKVTYWLNYQEKI